MMDTDSNDDVVQLRGLEERCQLPHWSLGYSPSRSTIWCCETGFVTVQNS